MLSIFILFIQFYSIFGDLPKQTSCGVQSTSPNIQGNTLNRIIGGNYAVTNSWPWIVSLREYMNGKVSTHLCGGK